MNPKDAQELSRAQETCEFDIHPAVFYDVVLRQAGTLGKALLEGVQNSVDAKATRCDITLSADKVTIKDDGVGFRDRSEIDTFFRVFGLPHTESERVAKTYGQFRIGRGQMFAFGRNVWRTAEFTIDTDVKRRGRRYVVASNGLRVDGCEIIIELYDRLAPSALAEVARELERAVKYVPIPVTLNGRRLSKDVAAEKWTHQSEDALLRLNDTQVLSVYNLGVHVLDCPAHRFGVGGVIVSRQQLKTNFSRNDVMSDCPVWRRIRKVVDANATDRNLRKPTLNDAERQRLADQLVRGEIDTRDAADLRLFTDVTGRHWSLTQFCRLHGRYNGVYTSAPKNDRRGDAVHQQRIAFVIADETLARFGCEGNPEQMMGLIAAWNGIANDWRHKPFEEVAAGISADFRLLRDGEVSQHDRCALACVERIGRSLSYALCPDYRSRRRRAMVLGKSGCAEGWTDGDSFIALEVRYVRRHRDCIEGWVKIALLMLHEFCHDESDMKGHGHDAEFYQKFHDHADKAVEAGVNAFRSYVKRLSSLNLPLPAKALADTFVAGAEARS
jgi:hypothetical protein